MAAQHEPYSPEEAPRGATPPDGLGVPIVERVRPFAALDAVPDACITWLAAGGGYGKTTLARSYARRLDRPLLELPIPDGGLATGELFHLLRSTSAAVRGPEAPEPPAYTAEHSGSPRDFARRFAEVLCQGIREPVLLLVDDLEHLGEGPAAELLPDLLGSMAGDRVRIVIASRGEPPRAWAGLRGRGRLRVLDESALAFTPEEVAALLGRRDADEQTQVLHARTRGWAAALMLALEQWRRHGELPAEGRLQQPLDDWFAAEVTDRLAPAERELLRVCAVPARIPAAGAARVAGMSDAPECLQRLALQHAFVELERAGGEPGFRLHELFRSHLQRRLTAEHGSEGLRDLAGRWGRVLWERGDWTGAAPLLVQARDWGALGDGLKEAAPVLLREGRGESLLAWLREMPEAMRRDDPELTLWEGMCLILHDTAQARSLLIAAWEGLAPRQLYAPMAVAWTGIIDSAWLEKAHVAFYDRWIDEFQRHEAAFRERLPRDLWLMLLRGMVAAMAHGRPHDPALARWEREAHSTLAGEMPDNERLMLAGQLMFLYTWQLGRRAGAERVMAVMRGHADAVERAAPLPRAVWLTFTSLHAFLFEADLDTCVRDARRARELITAYGLRSWECGVPPLQAAICFEDAGTLRPWLDWFLRGDGRAHRAFYDTFHAHFLACQAWLDGDAHTAVHHCRESLVAVEGQGAPVLSAGFRAALAGCLADTGAHAEALREAAAARRAREGFPSAFLDLLLYTPLARIPLLRGQPRRALPYLRRLLESGAREYLFFPFLIRRRELAALCALGLQAGIQPDYVRWLIARTDLAPPEDPALRLVWPWPVRLRTLGGLHVDRRDTEGEAPPLPRQGQAALLATLVAAGPRGLDRATLAARLWPDSRRDRALNSLHVACHRTREQLGDAAAILSEGGRIALNPERIWVDAWELVALARRPDALDRKSLEAAVDYCTGEPELPGADELERDFLGTEVASAHQQLVEALALRLEGEEPRQALRCSLDALGQASLNDTLWSVALRSAAAVGHGVLERVAGQMRQTFATLLDEPPPAALETLARRLERGGAGDG